jgi:5-methylthioadenosine/S-adenosylhomocysteine deaminase
MNKPRIDLLVTNGTVLTMDPRDTSIEGGGVAISGDRIVSTGPAGIFEEETPVRTIDARGGVILPGLVNTHTHAAMTCFRGLADDLPLMTWLESHIFPAEAKLTEDIVFRGALLACAEMILSGTTCFCDMYLFEAAVARAARDAGIRAVVGEVLYDFPSPNYGFSENGFAYTERLISEWKNHPLITVAVEPHSPYLCSPGLLRKAAALARRHDALLVTHLSETEGEVARMREKQGRTPVGFLESIGLLSPGLLACHCVAVDDADIELLARHGVKVSHNPESNMKLASGAAPVPKMLRSGICVGLGTDGCASNNDLDLFLEMDTAAKLHKVRTMDPTVMDARTVLRMSTIEGAKALGLGDETGSLEPGKKADLIVIDTRKPHLTPMYNPVSHLVYAVRGSDVQASVIDGRVVMEAGELLSIDLDRTMAEVIRISKEIREG